MTLEERRVQEALDELRSACRAVGIDIAELEAPFALRVDAWLHRTAALGPRPRPRPALGARPRSRPRPAA